jgi:hypothetical protein
MKYQSLEQIALLADVHPGIAMSRRERLEHWAELLERQRSRRLSTIEGTEFGSPREREGKRADSSPLTVAFEDPILRVEGLRGDRVGDADGTARETNDSVGSWIVIRGLSAAAALGFMFLAF